MRVRKHRWGLIGFVLLTIVAFMSSGCNQQPNWRDRPSEARRIAEGTTVKGFVRTAIVDVPDDNHTYANAFYIGPAPKPDPLAVVEVPTIQLSAVAAPAPVPSWDNDNRLTVVVAKGKRPDGCMASVAYSVHPEADPTRSSFNLTPEQLDAVRNGTQVFVQLTVSACGS